MKLSHNSIIVLKFIGISATLLFVAAMVLILGNHFAPDYAKLF